MEIIRVRMVNGNEECENSPIEILKELKKINSKLNGNIIEFDKLNLEEIHINLDNLDEANTLINKNSETIFYKNDKSFFIGGDHSISFSILKSFKKIYNNPLLIVFDSSVDVLEEERFPNNKNWLRKLINEDFKNIVLIGARNLNKEEIEFLKENKITWIKIDLLREIEEVCDLIMERARLSQGFYISIDLSVLEPCFAPGARAVPGGLSSNELIYFIQRLSLLNNFKGGDIVEINPNKDINNITLKLGARLIAEML